MDYVKKQRSGASVGEIELQPSWFAQLGNWHEALKVLFFSFNFVLDFSSATNCRVFQLLGVQCQKQPIVGDWRKSCRRGSFRRRNGGQRWTNVLRQGLPIALLRRIFTLSPFFVLTKLNRLWANGIFSRRSRTTRCSYWFSA